MLRAPRLTWRSSWPSTRSARGQPISGTVRLLARTSPTLPRATHGTVPLIGCRRRRRTVPDLATLREDVALFTDRVFRRPLWRHQLEAAASTKFITCVAKARRTGGTELVERLAAHACFRERNVKAVVLSAAQEGSRRGGGGLWGGGGRPGPGPGGEAGASSRGAR